MLLHAPTIRHVLDTVQAMMLSADETSRPALLKAYESLNIIFVQELDQLPMPELLQKESHEELLVRVAAYFGCTVEALKSHDRHGPITGARHVAAWLLRKRIPSYPVIGMLLGNRDHTTIMSACNRVEKEIRNGTKLGKDAQLLAAETGP